MQNDLISRSALLFVLNNDFFPAKGEFARAMDIARFSIQDAPAVDAVVRQKLIDKLFPFGVPLTREDWNYSINAKAVYEAIMKMEG